MSTSTDKKDVSGRSWDQITKNGTSSAGSMGTGGTGDSGKLSEQGAGRQSATRTDDVLDDGSSQAEGQGYAGSAGGQLQTGMEGIGELVGGKGANRQSGGQSGLNRQGGDAARPNEGEANQDRTDGKR